MTLASALLTGPFFGEFCVFLTIQAPAKTTAQTPAPMVVGSTHDGGGAGFLFGRVGTGGLAGPLGGSGVANRGTGTTW